MLTWHIVMLLQIKDLGCKAGVVLNPATPLSQIENVLGFVGAPRPAPHADLSAETLALPKACALEPVCTTLVLTT